MSELNVKLGDERFCLNACMDVKAICQPLRALFPFHHFWYSRTYSDGSSSALSTNLKVMQNLDKTLIAGADDSGHYIKSGYLLQPDFEDVLIPGEVLRFYWNEFEIDNQLILLKEDDTYTELYSFVASPGTRGIYSFYANHLKLFNRFAMYFQEKAASLINQSEQHKIIVPKYDRASVGTLSDDGLDQKSFKDEIKLSKYRLRVGDGLHYLTSRGFEVVSGLARGLSDLLLVF